MSLIFFISIIGVIIDIYLSFYFLLKSIVNDNKNKRILLFFMYLSFGLWGVTQLVNYFYPESVNTIWTMRLGYAFVLFGIIYCHYYLINYALSKKTKINWKLNFFISLLIFGIALSPIIISDIEYVNDIVVPKTNIIPALIYTIIILFIAVQLIYKIIHTYRTTKNTAIKTSMYLLVITIIITAISAIIFNLVIPNINNSSPKTSPLLGFISSLIFTTTSAYIFSRIRYSHVKVYFSKLLYFTLLAFIAYITFHIVYYIQIQLWGSIHNKSALISGVIYSFIFIVILNYLINNYLYKYINKIVNVGILDINIIKKQFIKSVSKTNSFDKFFNLIKILIQQGISEGDNFILVLNTLDDTKLYSTNRMNNTDEKLKKCIQKLSEYRIINNPLLISELYLKENKKSEFVNKIINCLSELNIELIQPLKSDNKILGYLIFKKKPGVVAYFNEEIDFIVEISQLITLGINKIMLYEQQKEFNQTLQSKVDEQTKEIQKKAKELEHKVEALEEARRKEHDMLDILGHELRTPLTTVRNSISLMQMLSKKGELNKEKVDKYLEKAHENADREIKLLETMLSTTKIDNQKIDMYFEKCDMIDVVNDSLDGLKEKAEKKGLEIKVEKGEKCDAYGDRHRLQEVADNLIANAIKYTDEGYIRIKLECGVKREDKEKGYVKMEIEDTGEGISKEDQKNLGKKFYRAKTYVNEGEDTGMRVVRAGGTGLGLYVTYRLIEMMGGEVEVESELGKGSKFIVYLPEFRGQESKGTKKLTAQEKFMKKKEDQEKKKGVRDSKKKFI